MGEGERSLIPSNTSNHNQTRQRIRFINVGQPTVENVVQSTVEIVVQSKVESVVLRCFALSDCSVMEFFNVNPKKTGLFWRLERLGAMMAPPLEISAVDRAIAAKICTMVVCDVIYKIVY